MRAGGWQSKRNSKAFSGNGGKTHYLLDDDGNEEIRDMTRAESIAQAFHETYERLAPRFSYKTRDASAVPWDQVPDNNKQLMSAVVGELLEQGTITAPARYVKSHVSQSSAADDPTGTIRDTGNRTSVGNDDPIAHVNRYFIKWSPPYDLDETAPWVALNHEAGLQRMPNELMDAYPVISAAEMQRRLAWTGGADAR